MMEFFLWGNTLLCNTGQSFGKILRRRLRRRRALSSCIVFFRVHQKRRRRRRVLKVESFTESSSPTTTLVLLRVLVARVLPRAFIPVRSDDMRRLATYVRSWTAYLSAAEPLERINKFRRKRSYMRRWSRIATLEIVLLSAVCSIIKRDSVNNKEQLRQTPGVCT